MVTRVLSRSASEMGRTVVKGSGRRKQFGGDGSPDLSYPAMENVFCERFRFVGRKMFGDVLGRWQPRLRLVLAIAGCGDASREATQRNGDSLRG